MKYALLLTLTGLLAACGPATSTTPGVPAAHAADPALRDNSAQWLSAEQDALRYANELRASGTIGGVDYRAGTCAQGVTLPLPAFTGSPAAHLAAQRQAQWLAEYGFDRAAPHEQRDPTHPAFYGRTVKDRVDRAARDLGVQGAVFAAGENAAAGYPSALDVTVAWLRSPGHCANLMQPGAWAFGAGYAERPAAAGYDDMHLNFNWVQVFVAQP